MQQLPTISSPIPGTLTGSIGVAGGKVNLAGLWKQFGITWEGVSYGQTADMWSFNHPFSAAETARMNDMMDSVYRAFVDRVAEGRHMTVADAEQVARGRVWTGRQAKANHLVDDLGGLDAALDYAARQIGLKDRTQLGREIYPEAAIAARQAGKSRRPERRAESAAVHWWSALQRAIMASQYMTYQPLTSCALIQRLQ